MTIAVQVLFTRLDGWFYYKKTVQLAMLVGSVYRNSTDIVVVLLSSGLVPYCKITSFCHNAHLSEVEQVV